MTIDAAQPRQIPALRQLWKAAFSEEEAYLDAYFSTAFSCERCLCALEGEKLLAALHWLDCFWQDQKFAYLYAVATDAQQRGRGICRALMEQTHRVLAQTGYAGAILVPASEPLQRMYAGFGYQPGPRRERYSIRAAGQAVPLEPLSAAEYARRRRSLLPGGGLIQEHENLDLLQTQEALFGGDGWLLACHRENDRVTAPEFLGDPAILPGVLQTLGAAEGTFYAPGQAQAFAMLKKLTPHCAEPSYLGFAFE